MSQKRKVLRSYVPQVRNTYHHHCGQVDLRDTNPQLLKTVYSETQSHSLLPKSLCRLPDYCTTFTSSQTQVFHSSLDAVNSQSFLKGQGAGFSNQRKSASFGYLSATFQKPLPASHLNHLSYNIEVLK